MSEQATGGSWHILRLKSSENAGSLRLVEGGKHRQEGAWVERALVGKTLLESVMSKEEKRLNSILLSGRIELGIHPLVFPSPRLTLRSSLDQEYSSFPFFSVTPTCPLMKGSSSEGG